MEKDGNRKKYFAIAGLIAFGVILFAAMMNLGAVMNTLSVVMGYFLPLLAGLIIAFVLDVPSRAFVRLIRKLFPKVKPGKGLNSAGAVLTLVSLAAVIAVMWVIVMPVLVSSASSAYRSVCEKLPEWKAFIQEYSKKNGVLAEYIGSLGSGVIPSGVAGNTGSVLKTLMGAASSTISGIAAFVMGLIISVYILFDRDTVLRHAEKLVTASFSSKAAGEIRRVSAMISDTYSKFLSGQCVEALILGVLLFVSLTVFDVPYAALTAVLTTVFSFVPYIGPFAAAATGAFLTYITVPEKFLLFMIIYLVVQFIEGQFIYPHVVGNSVGLSPLLTLLSVLIGGSLMGLFGMLFFIPLMSVLYMLGYEWVNRRIAAKKAGEIKAPEEAATVPETDG